MDTAPSFYESLAQWSEVGGGIAFLIAAYLLFRKYLAPAVRAAQVSRNAELLESERRRDALKAEAATARGELEAADREAAAIVTRARADAERERERIIAEAQADGERSVASAEGELDRARMAARARLRTELVGKALERARAQAGGRIDAPTNARLVGSTVKTLVGRAEHAS